MNRFSKKPISIVLGAAFALTGLAAQASVFQATDLGAGYMVAAAGEGKCGEGKCGEGKKVPEGKVGVGGAEGKCGEGKCGEAKMSMMDTNKDSKISLAEHQAHSAAMFKKADANSDGSVTAAEMKTAMEAKCGEGKCGEKK